MIDYEWIFRIYILSWLNINTHNCDTDKCSGKCFTVALVSALFLLFFSPSILVDKVIYHIGSESVSISSLFSLCNSLSIQFEHSILCLWFCRVGNGGYFICDNVNGVVWVGECLSPFSLSHPTYGEFSPFLLSLSLMVCVLLSSNLDK